MKTNPGVNSQARLLALGALLLAVLACSLNPVPLPVPTLTSSPQTAVPPLSGKTQTPGGPLLEIPLPVGFGARGPFYEVYFTDPENKYAAREEGGLDEVLVTALDGARISVDVAAYSLSLYSIQKALINAFNRGVLVRVVMESNNMEDRVPKALRDAGISMVGDQRESLMHDKFIVIDRAEVWTGSMNFTTTGTYADNNNLMRIRSKEVAEDFTVEFEEMFKDDFFGQDIVAATPYQEISVDGINLEVYFSPDDHVARRIAALLRSAQHSIQFMAYSLTANDFGDILRQKKRAGLSVSGVMERSLAKQDLGSEYDAFYRAGMDVIRDGNPGLLHHKVIIIDESIVIMGSYNFTASAERNNDENVVIFFDPLLAAEYIKEFQRVYDTALHAP